jgi:hypothetical protein
MAMRRRAFIAGLGGLAAHDVRHAFIVGFISTSSPG